MQNTANFRSFYLASKTYILINLYIQYILINLF